MKVWYNIEVQMAGENERNYDIDEAVGRELGFAEDEIDEREPHNLTALFAIEKKPGKMREDVARVLEHHPEIHYIDVIYRYDSENVPDRFVAWSDGHTQEYTGKIIFEEDK